jgi:hypothetical protein
MRAHPIGAKVGTVKDGGAEFVGCLGAPRAASPHPSVAYQAGAEKRQ